jgi:hypothetical protein
MHFWIDKPAGRYYGFSGRRYPAMSFPKTHFTGQHRRCGNQDVTRLQMVTPVHRFQTISTSGNSAGPSNLNSNRSLRPNIQNNNNNNNNNNINNSNNNNNNNNNSSSSYSSNNITSGIHAGVQLGQDNFNNNNATNSGYNQQVLPPTSAANRGLLNFSEFNDAEMAGYRLRCSVWIIFVLATGFVAAAKFYFDHQQGAGLEVLVFCGLLVILLMSGCFYSIICRQTQNQRRQESQVDSIATVTVANTIPNESIRQVAIPVRQNPPPPYHIAILIPPPTSSDEAPPPAYDKIVK